MATLETTLPTAPTAPRAGGTLALLLQEALTVAIRLRANRQVAADADSFRAHVKQLLATVDHEARRMGYGSAQVKLVIYAYVAFLDESVLNSQQPMFAGWPRQPLQEELFGDHVAGETFFRHLDALLGAQDSAELADVLEVFQLCMLLGFRGRYGLGDPSGLQSRINAVQQKIQRSRGAAGELSPAWAVPAGEAVPATRDPWVTRLALLAGVGFATACVLFILFRFLLAPSVTSVQTLVSQLVS